MANRLFRLLVVFVLAMFLVLPGQASADSAPGSPDSLQAPLVLTWSQRNVSGFGDKNNAAVSALEFFGGLLYAGATNDGGAQVWRTADGDNWSRVFPLPTGFDPFGHGVLFDMIVFNGYLYAGIGTWYALGTTGQIWRTADGVDWKRVTGLWDQTPNNAGVNNFAIFGGALYATVNNPNQGIEVYRSFTGNSNDWVRVAAGSFGLKNSYQVPTGLATFNNYLYVALEGQTAQDGARVYRTSDGTNWTPANAPGFGNNAYHMSGGFAVHRGSLYVGTGSDDTPNGPPDRGGQVWGTSDGTNWARVATNGFSNPRNYKVEGLVSTQGTLFAFADNNVTGAEVWSSTYSTAWEQSNIPGFGSANNKAVALWSNGSGILANQLFLGTFNQDVGGQVWSATPPAIQPLTKKVYLPYIGRR